MPSNITINGLTFTPEDVNELAEAVVSIIQTTAKEPSQYEEVDSVAGVTSIPVFKQSGNTYTLVRVLVSLLKGADGKQIELRANETHLQWRLLDVGGWIDLLPVSVLQQPAADAVEIYGSDITDLKNIKFDAVEKTDEGLVFYANGEAVFGPVEVGGGGSTMRLQNLGTSSVGIAAGQQVVLSFSFSSVDAETGEDTGDGTAEYYVNSVRVETHNICQGDNYFDATNYLKAGFNTCRIKVTDSYGAQRTLNVSVTVVALSLSSTFDDSLSYDAAITFPFTPLGSGQKTIHFVLDGEETGTVETAATNRQLTYALPVMEHGAHSLQAFATMTVEGIDMQSNILNYSIIFTEAGHTDVIISSSFDRTEAVQYETLLIAYSVYNPQALTSAVELIVNGVTVSQLNADRLRQTWSYRIRQPGTLTLGIVSGAASRTFSIDVEASSIDSEAETDGLELYLTSNGRSNSEINPSLWQDAAHGISAQLTGFNFRSNGWMPDGDGVTVLRVSSGATVVIPFKPFAADFKTTGKTIEFEIMIHDVEDFDVLVIQCRSGNRGFVISANEIRFASALSSLSAKFREDEIIRLSIVVQDRYGQRLILLYINGIMSGAQQYSLSDDFSQPSPVGITIGSSPVKVDVYNIRSYSTGLNAIQVLNNYIADTAGIAKKLALFDRNRIYDASGEIVYSDLVRQLPCMTITGELPTFKGDKKTVRVTFQNETDPEKSFTSINVQIDVQGTSSQFYPRKNYKTKHNSGFDMTSTGENVSKYVLRNDDIPAKVFCEKADFAESAGAHNTGLAVFINDLLTGLSYKTPPQFDDENVRTTVDGYPVAIFHRLTDDAPRIFLGKYNFNHDKDAQDVFGFTDESGQECWEFLNNTSGLCLFKSADFSGAWGDDLAARFPDGYGDATNIEILWQWVVGCIGNPAKFKAEIAEHFNVNNVLSYYLITELFGMVDQRAKNMFATSWGNEGAGEYKWYFIFYDNDTSNGINNEGAIAFGYGIEDGDASGSGHVWNGWDSELWNLVKAAFADEIKAMYADMRTSGLLTYDRVSHVLNEEQCAKWCEVIYNMDGQYKYIQPIIESGNASYLYALQGSRLEHRKWWLRNRFYYMDGKYNTGDFASDFITMRLYTPSSWQGVEPDPDFDLTLFKDGYVRVKFGSYVIGQRASAGDTVHIDAPDIVFNDTETIVYGVSSVRSLGSLAAKYPGTVDISQARRITELIAGSDAAGYQNLNLMHVSVGNNTLLKVVDVQNCPNLTEPLDLSGCASVSEVYAAGTGLSMVALPAAGVLEILRLPATIANLTIKNQSLLTDDGLTLAGTENISTLVIENTNGIDVWTLVKTLLGRNPRVLNRVRLIGIDVADDDLSVVEALTAMQGVDENGMSVGTAVVTGRISVPSAYEGEVAEIELAFPELEIAAGTLIGDPVTTFTFSSAGNGESLTNVSFTCNFPYTKVNDTVYTVKAAAGKMITLSFSADNHVSVTRSYTVTTTQTRTLAVQYIPLRTIIITDAGGNPLSGAVATLADGSKYNADAAGKIYIRTLTSITGTVRDESYGMGTLNIAASVSDDTHTIKLTAFVTAKFVVRSSPLMTLVPDVTVEMGGVTAKTDSDGAAAIRVSPGTFTYKATYKNSVIETRTISLYTDAVLLVQSPVISIEEQVPAKDGSIILLLHATDTGAINMDIVTGGTNHTIDWGDGTTTAVAGSGSFPHSYSHEGARAVRITNPGGITSVSGGTAASIAKYRGLWSMGDSGLSFTKSEYDTNWNYALVLGNDVFKNVPDLTSLAGFFSSKPVMWVEDGIFDNLVNVTSVSGIFASSKLQKAPDSAFANMFLLNDITNAFSQAGDLTDVPADTFGNHPNVTSASGLLRGTKISRIYKDFLKGCPNITDFSNFALLCSSLSVIEDGFLVNNYAATSAYYMFRQCLVLSSVPDSLLANAPLQNIQNMFGYAGLTVFPGILKNKTLLNNVDLAFSYCQFTVLTGTDLLNLPPKMLDGSYRNGRDMFAQNSELTEVTIPASMAYMPVSMIMGCGNLKTVTCLAGNPPVMEAAITNTSFYGCNALESIYVPDDSADAYKAAQGWSNYAGKIKPVSEKP
jgi:hypothetical protein